MITLRQLSTLNHIYHELIDLTEEIDPKRKGIPLDLTTTIIREQFFSYAHEKGYSKMPNEKTKNLNLTKFKEWLDTVIIDEVKEK